MSQTVKPLIDDAYWFDYSKELVEGKQGKRDAAAAALQKLVVWLCGIYTASAAIGFTLSGKDLSFWPAFIIAAASGALIIVYWGTVWVQVPITVNFDPRSPTEIKQAYNEAVKRKSFRLGVTLFGSVIAAVMVSVALVVASVSKPVTQDFSNISTNLAELDGKLFLSVTAWVSETDEVVIIATPLLADDEQGEVVRAVVLPSSEGLLQTSVEIPDKAATRIQLELSWTTKKGTEISLGKDVETKRP